MKNIDNVLEIIIAFIIVVGFTLITFGGISSTSTITNFNSAGTILIRNVLTNNGIILALIVLFFAIVMILLFKALPSKLGNNRGLR